MTEILKSVEEYSDEKTIYDWWTNGCRKNNHVSAAERKIEQCCLSGWRLVLGRFSFFSHRRNKADGSWKHLFFAESVSSLFGLWECDFLMGDAWAVNSWWDSGTPWSFWVWSEMYFLDLHQTGVDEKTAGGCRRGDQNGWCYWTQSAKISPLQLFEDVEGRCFQSDGCPCSRDNSGFIACFLMDKHLINLNIVEK